MRHVSIVLGFAAALVCAACAEPPPPPPPVQQPVYAPCQDRAQAMTDALLAGRADPGSSTLESDGDFWLIHYTGHGENQRGAVTFYVEKRACEVIRTVVAY